ncbi:quinol monooxygenase YgiN [Afipia massiliensis]|uniref:Quinol monooxygenase YgiN n=1 Tax=Afipia massiliensis TaxID=211460 RepID=A0A840MXC8_9BRAD|nr:putative quinol monooxygenase [Afipia massiliensis]MBB5052553.1 quinol monooxygenase YgiN [Afipia massiliensis]
MIYVVATTKVKPEGREAFIAGAKTCIAETHKEKGCISYELHASVNDPDVFVFVERWETRDDLTAHSRAPHLKAWRELSAPMKASPTAIEIISGGKVQKL